MRLMMENVSGILVMKKQKVYYYHDMKNDDFATTNIETVKLPDDYKYIKRNFLSIF